MVRLRPLPGPAALHAFAQAARHRFQGLVSVEDALAHVERRVVLERLFAAERDRHVGPLVEAPTYDVAIQPRKLVEHPRDRP